VNVVLSSDLSPRRILASVCGYVWVCVGGVCEGVWVGCVGV
jgi:hypothetical protein